MSLVPSRRGGGGSEWIDRAQPNSKGYARDEIYPGLLHSLRSGVWVGCLCMVCMLGYDCVYVVYVCLYMRCVHVYICVLCAGSSLWCVHACVLMCIHVDICESGL